MWGMLDVFKLLDVTICLWESFLKIHFHTDMNFWINISFIVWKYCFLPLYLLQVTGNLKRQCSSAQNTAVLTKEVWLMKVVSPSLRDQPCLHSGSECIAASHQREGTCQRLERDARQTAGQWYRSLNPTYPPFSCLFYNWWNL